jgi:hypothetical protein
MLLLLLLSVKEFSENRVGELSILSLVPMGLTWFGWTLISASGILSLAGWDHDFGMTWPGLNVESAGGLVVGMDPSFG